MNLSRDPDKLREWKRTSKPLTRKSRLNPVNEDRREKRFRDSYGSEERVRWIKRQECVVPGCDRRECDAAHVVSKAAGGGPEDLVSLCRPHHTEQHSVGIETFQERHGVDLRQEAEDMAARWESLQGEL